VTKRGGLPAGHPSHDHYLRTPIIAGEEFIGMAGIANRPSGCNKTLARDRLFQDYSRLAETEDKHMPDTGLGFALVA